MTARLAFRTRLMLAYTAIVAIAVVLLGAVAFATVRITLDKALRTRLETTTQALRSVVDVRGGKLRDLDREDREQFLSLLGQRVNGAVLRGDGSLMASNLAVPPASILTAIASAGPLPGTARIDGATVVYVALPITADGVRYGTVAAWESQSTYNDAVNSTLIALAAAGLVVIVAAAAAGGVLTRRMLRPITELSTMISEIEAADLTERLEWSGPDDELGLLCATFDRLLDRLETAFEHERRFIADASHELRTPLSVMRAEVELSLMHERSPEAYRSALQRLQRETQRLENLAQNLLLTARHDAGAITAAEISAAELAEHATAHMQPLAASRGISLTFQPQTAATIVADAAMFESALAALIDNALRFARTRVTVVAESDARNAAFRVTDDGPGFSEAALREATGRFWRDDPGRSGGGTGLGLAIVRSIVERHHGTIRLANAAPENGAVVVIAIPHGRAG